MTQMYPVFTDGKRFYHMEEVSPKGCRFAYFSKLKLREWNKKEKLELKGKAKKVYESWGKKFAKQNLDGKEKKEC